MSVLPQRFRLNVITNYATTATLVLVALVSTPILVHGLGREEYGIWVLVGSTVMYLDLFNIGFGRANVKFVAEHHALGDLDRVRRTLATSFLVLAVPAAIGLAVAVGFAFLFPHVFHVPHELAMPATILVILVSLDIASSVASDAFGGALTALQRYDLLNATIIAVLVLQTIAWAVLLSLGYGLVALGAATAGLGLTGQLARFLLVRRLIPGTSISPRLFDRSFVRPLASLSGWMALADAGRLLISRVDTVIVGLVIGVPAAGVYAVGQKLALLGARAVLAASQMFYPHASQLAARGDEEGLRRMLVRGTQIVLAIAIPVAVVLGVLAKPALRAWVGPQFEQARMVVVYLVAAMVAKALTDTAMNVLRGTGHAKPHALIVSAEAVLNFALSIALGYELGIAGVALATLIAGSISNVFLLLPYACRFFGISYSGLLASVVRTHAAPAAASTAVGVLLLTRLDLDGIPFVGGAGVAMLAVYALVYGLTSLSRTERRALLGRVRHQSAG